MFEDGEQNEYVSIGDIRFRSNRKSGVFFKRITIYLKNKK
jgi:hypothetical protein